VNQLSAPVELVIAKEGKNMNTNINRDVQAFIDSLSSIENDLKGTPTVLLTGKQIIKNSSLSQQGDLINIYP
jgi:hypothetical protein